MADHMRTELVADALRMTIGARRPAPGLVFHSDRGTQYTSAEFTALLDEHQITQSLSRPRQCWDNAVAESFFASLKTEMIDRQSWATRAHVRRAVFDYIEIFFNRQRFHSSLHAHRVRGDHPPSHYRSGVIIKLSVGAGQPQCSL